jgi:hypothetical protein
MLERLHRVVASHKDKVLEVGDCLSVAPSCFKGLTDRPLLSPYFGAVVVIPHPSSLCRVKGQKFENFE